MNIQSTPYCYAKMCYEVRYYEKKPEEYNNSGMYSAIREDWGYVVDGKKNSHAEKKKTLSYHPVVR